MIVHDLKPYRRVAIDECGEPLAAVAGPHLILADPHPYMAAGAPYAEVSPWYLRAGVLEALNRAGEGLQEIRPGWKFLLTDALRPVAVQFYMVDHTLRALAAQEGLDADALEETDRARLMSQVLTIWAVPSEDPTTPPPHSTGAALDVTMVDRNGKPALMGGEIDELAPYSAPDFYIATPTQEARVFHSNRAILNQLMRAQGFERHPDEWWHFSYGDQLWAWLRQQAGERQAVAKYGRAPGA